MAELEAPQEGRGLPSAQAKSEDSRSHKRARDSTPLLSGASEDARDEHLCGSHPDDNKEKRRRAQKVPRFQGSDLRRYVDLKPIGKGTFGTVFSALDEISKRRVAMKKVAWGASEDGISPSAMREIGLLRDLNDENIVALEEVVFDEESALYMVFERLDCDLRSLLMQTGALGVGEVQLYMLQLMKGINYLHGQRVLHRDLKPQNVLVDTSRGLLKIADFGLSRSSLCPVRPLTVEVVTLWYRAPEILLGERLYSAAIDIWSLGCIFAEMSSCQPLFQADSEIDLIFRIFRSLGTPAEEHWPGVTSLPNFQRSFPKWPSQKLERLVPNLPPSGIDLLQSMLRYRPVSRITAVEALQAKYFAPEVFKSHATA